MILCRGIEKKKGIFQHDLAAISSIFIFAIVVEFFGGLIE